MEIPAYPDSVRGRRMATVPKYPFDLEVAGGIFVNEACVIYGNLVSGRTFHDNAHYLGSGIKMLEDEKLKDTLLVWGGEFGRTTYCQGN